jgi:hypothetical protein
MLILEGSAVEKRSITGTRLVRHVIPDVPARMRRVVGRGRRVDKDGLIHLEQRRGSACQTLLLLDRLTQPLLEGVLVLRESRRNRPAVGPLDLPLTFQ